MTQHGQPLSIDILSKFQVRLKARRLRIKQGVQGQSKKLKDTVRNLEDTVRSSRTQ